MRLRGLFRLVLIVLTGLLSLSAIPGGIALLGGYAPPIELLTGSFFADFTIPALSLLVVVGGSAALATVLLARGSRFALLSAAFAGVVVMSFEFVEVLAIGSPSGPAQVMQLLYFAVGLLLVSASLAAVLVDLLEEGRARRE